MKTIKLLPKYQRVLKIVGENIKLARLRRKLTVCCMVERMGISRPTYYSVESGSPTVSIGIFLQAFVILGLVSDFEKLALEDPIGRKIQDVDLLYKTKI